MSEFDVLKEQIRGLNNRVDELQLTHQLISSLDKNIALQAQALEHIREENQRQNQQIADLAAMLSKVSDTLTALAQSQREQTMEYQSIKTRVNDIEAELSANRKKVEIDVTELQREDALSKLKKNTAQIGIPAGLGVLIYELIQKFLGK